MKHAFWSVILLCTIAPSAAQETMQQSPITPGFWTWPREKLTDRNAITTFCREKFALQFADGRFFGVSMRNAGKTFSPPVIDEVGECHFNRETQVERCELRLPNADGSATKGITEGRFSFDAERVLKMTVTATVTDSSGANKPDTFDVFPVRCPDDTVWDALNDVPPRP
jgi:hypothetical protein